MPVPPALAPEGGAPRNFVAGTLGLAGALVVGVSSFLPWAEITQSFLIERTQTVSGWNWFDHGIETGPLFALLALVGAALAGLLISQVVPLAVRITTIAVGALGVGLAVFAISDILDRKAEVQTLGEIDVTLQYGIWLIVGGAATILVAGIVAKHRR